MHCFRTALLFLLTALTLHAASEVATWQVLENSTLETPRLVNGCLTVRHDGKLHRFRLYFADPLAEAGDAPERKEDQAGYFRVPSAAIEVPGARASATARDFLGQGFEVVTRWEDARAGEEAACAFALLRKNGRYLSATLIQEGLARLHALPPATIWPDGPSPGAFLSALKQAERSAQAAGQGIWARAGDSHQMRGSDLASGHHDAFTVGPPIDLNTASAAELASLPGIGPALAQRIIRARPFHSVEALQSVPGISHRSLEGFRHRIRAKEPEP